MAAMLRELLRIIGELVLSLAPALAETETQELLHKVLCCKNASLAEYVGLKSVICATSIFLCFVCANYLKPFSIFCLLAAIPAGLCAYIAPDLFLQWFAENNPLDR